MTQSRSSQRVRDLNENTWFQFLGRLFQLLGIPVIVGLVLWQLGKQDSMSSAISVLTTRVENLDKDPYNGSDARRDFYARDLQIQQNSRRMNDIDGRINALELGAARRSGR